MALLAGEVGGHERAHARRGEHRADHARAEGEHVAVVVLDALRGGVGVVANGSTDAGQLAGGDGHSGAAAADDDTPVARRRRERRVKRPARCPGSRPGCRRRPARGPRPGRRRAPRRGTGRRRGRIRLRPSSSLPPQLELLACEQCRARERRPAGRSGRVGSRCSCRRPCTTNRAADSRAGSSSRSPAVETPPPTTTRSGSNVLIAFAMPTPSVSPRMRMASSASASPRRAAATTACPSPIPRARPRRSSARPAAWYSSDAVCGKWSAAGAPCWSSAPMIVWPISAAAPVAPAKRPPADHDAAADAGADREHHDDVGDRAHVVVVRLGERGDGRVVVDEGRDARGARSGCGAAGRPGAGCSRTSARCRWRSRRRTARRCRRPSRARGADHRRRAARRARRSSRGRWA